jgi:hypothetical protein
LLLRNIQKKAGGLTATFTPLRLIVPVAASEARQSIVVGQRLNKSEVMDRRALLAMTGL